MSPKASSRLGVWVALIAGLGAWFSFTLVQPFTVHVLDLLWLYLLIASFVAVAFRRFGVPLLTWQNPIASISFYAFFFVLIAAPILGVLFMSAPVTGLSSSLRFLMFATFPLLFATLKLNRASFLNGLSKGLVAAVTINLAYALLQSLEFNGVIPSGVLPHNTIGRALTGRSFDNWGRASGLFYEGNHLGYFGLFATAFFWGRFLLRPRLTPVVLTVFSLALPVLGNSRSALLLAVMVILLMPVTLVLLRKATNVRTLTAIAFSLLAGTVAVQILLNIQALRSAVNFSRILRVLELARGNLEADNSFRIRIEELWPAARAVINDYPLGTGVEPSTLIGTIDSAWITYFLQGSVPLALMFGLFILGAAWSGFQAMAGPRSIAVQAAGHSLVWVSIVISIGSLVLSPHHVPAMMVLWLSLYYVVAGRPGSAGDG